jgi:predicted XRE-type DNA-binding protein
MNWTNLIEEIGNSGMSQKGIGAAIGKSQAWVSAVVRGEFGDVPWATGQKLIALHRKMTKRKQVS